MMLMNPGKKVASIIVGKLKSKGEPKSLAEGISQTVDEVKSLEKEPNDVEAALESAMEDFLGAMEAKDAKAMASALKDFNYLCTEEEGSYEPEKSE